ncbi:MAG: hypothetical protein ACI8XO_000776, partial [Verrucomicrobiales bacterium]|jgi:hypothetical protein
MQPGSPHPQPSLEGAYPQPGIPVEPMMDDPRLIELAQQRQANQSKAAAFGIALLVHVLIGLLLAFIVMAVLDDSPPELIVESTGPSDLPPTIHKEEFSKKISNDRPSPPSESSQVIVTNAISPISVPMVETITESPVIGDAANGMGFGGGGFGAGTGGSSFFGTSGGGNNIYIVIDTSTSMIGNCGRDGCDAIIKEVTRTVARLTPGTRFNIICFGNDADALSKKSLRVSGDTQKQAKKFMADYFQNTSWTRTRTSKFGKKGTDNKGIAYHPIMPGDFSSLKGTSGGSRMDLALVAAFEQKPSSIFLIADGEPGTNRGGKKLGQEDLIKLIVAEAKRAYGGAPLPTVNAISVKDQGEKMLRAIAREFKGKYKSIDPARA